MLKPFRAIALTTLTGLAAFTLPAATPALTGIDVGYPLPGSIETTNDASGKPVHVIQGSGADIWGTADNFYYAYFMVTNDFDYVVKVASHVGNSGDGGWSKAELMARLDDGTGSGPLGGDPFIANMANRPTSDTANGAPAGVNNRGPQWRAIRDDQCTWTTPNPAYPPNAANNWLRLERVGSVFYMYTSDDGQNWHMYNPYDPQGWDTAGSWPPGTDNPAVASFTNAWPNVCMLGLAVTAHNGGDYSTVIFTDFGPYTPKPIAITTQPTATLSVAQNKELKLSVAATGDPVHYQWLKNNVPIARAVGPTYTVALAQVSDAGTYKVKVFGGGTEILSSESVVSVTVDTEAPTLKTLTPVSFTGIRLEFSEPVTDTALATANYKLDKGLTVSAVARVTPSVVELTTSTMGEGVDYVLTINGVKDTAIPANTIATDTTLPFKSLVFDLGMVTYERWDNANGDPGDLNAFVTAINDGTIRPPDINSAVAQFGGPWGATDNYSSRVRGYFIPPSSGDYVFFLASDDGSNLYLSTDDKPANKKLIAQESGWSNQYQWETVGGGSNATDKRSDSFSASEWTPNPNVITLVGGQRYYIEILHDEGTGGDGSDATFVKQGDEVPVPVPAQSASGMFLVGSVIGSYVNANGANVTITEQPKSATIAQNTTATLTVTATGTSVYGTNVSYQWQRAPKGSSTFADIVGATARTYTTPLLGLADDGVQFRVVCKVPGLPVNSAIAVISINNDVTPPTVASVGVLKDTPRIGVAYSELMDPATVTNKANYTVAGATVNSVNLYYGKYVELVLAANLTTAPAVTVSGVKDLAGNVIATVTPTVELVNMTSSDIGTPEANPLQPGYAFALGSGTFLVAGGGQDIWDAADGFHYVYQEFTGPFDMRARVETMNPSGLSTWAKAELMVRESTAPGSRHNSVCTTRPAPAGVDAIEAQWRDTTDGTSGGQRVLTPVPYPNTWLRLVREDVTKNDVKLYTSTDGAQWTLRNTHTTSDPLLPAKVLVGMAVTSHDNSGNDVLAEGVFKSFSVTAYTPVFDPQLKIAVDATGKLSVTWTSGTLVSSPTANGAYTAVAGATSPYQVDTTASATRFYRVQQ